MSLTKRSNPRGQQAPVPVSKDPRASVPTHMLEQLAEDLLNAHSLAARCGLSLESKVGILDARAEVCRTLQNRWEDV